MKRYIIHSPSCRSYVKLHYGMWNSGYGPGEVNSYGSEQEALAAIGKFESLKDCEIHAIHKTVDVITKKVSKP